MASELKTYDPKNVSVAFGGVLLGGFAEGSVVTAKRMNPTWSSKSGTDGEVVRSRSNDKRGEIKVSLMQTSGSNLVLSGMLAIDEATNGGVYPLLIKDNNGKTVWGAAEAWIQGFPDSQFEGEAGAREWTIECAELLGVEGGN